MPKPRFHQVGPIEGQRQPQLLAQVAGLRACGLVRRRRAGFARLLAPRAGASGAGLSSNPGSSGGGR